MQTKLSDGSIMVCGVLPKDADYKQVGDKNSSLCKFSVKVGERTSAVEGEKPQAIWANVQCWHSVARASQNLKKMDVALVIGKLEKRPYTANDGTQKIDTHINAEFVINMANVSQQVVQTAQSANVSLNDFEDLTDESGCPF